MSQKNFDEGMNVVLQLLGRSDRNVNCSPKQLFTLLKTKVFIPSDLHVFDEGSSLRDSRIYFTLFMKNFRTDKTVISFINFQSSLFFPLKVLYSITTHCLIGF